MRACSQTLSGHQRGKYPAPVVERGSRSRLRSANGRHVGQLVLGCAFHTASIWRILTSSFVQDTGHSSIGRTRSLKFQ
jgi:hypothetical protein